MRFNVGDRVRIKSLDWYNKNKSKRGNISFPYEAEVVFTSEMSSFCGQIVTISQKGYTQDVGFYRIREDHNVHMWTDEMIECKVEEETKPEPKFKVGEIVYSTTWQRDVIILDIFPDGFYKVGDMHLGWFRTDESGLRKEKITLPTDSQLKKPFKQKISLPEGYQFVDESGNVINATKIVLEKKKKEYPKTYEECAKILDCFSAAHIDGYKNALLEKLQELLVCRDAYWKIAGEEMGLGKPWKPRWNNSYQKKWIINFYQDEINLTNGPNVHFVLAFPTAEMRDDFKENFDPDIEICKELL